MPHASALPDAKVIFAQICTIEQQRQLLEEPDLIAPLLANLTQLLRNELNRLNGEYTSRYQQGIKILNQDCNWQQLEPEQRDQLMAKQLLGESAKPKIQVQSTADVLATLEHCNLSMFADRIAAMPTRFDHAAHDAAAMCEPQIQFVYLPRRTLKTTTDINEWINEVQQQLDSALQNGPVSIK
jgi:hypothetical protein